MPHVYLKTELLFKFGGGEPRKGGEMVWLLGILGACLFLEGGGLLMAFFFFHGGGE